MKVQSFNLTLFFSCIILLTGSLIAAPGDFDPSFGTNGQVINTIPGTNQATAVAIQADGKIVLASSSFNASSDFDFAVMRLNPNGTTDNGFGTNGLVIIPFDNFADEEASTIAVQPDGKIVVAGYAEFGSPGYDFAAARLNADGSLDATFGTGGKVKIPVSAANDFPYDAAIQNDGKIIIVGKGFNQPNSDAALVRLNANGTLDTSFNGTGRIVTPVGGGAAADSLAEVVVQTDGKIVAAGTDGADFAVLRFNPNGAFDPTFNGSGKATTPVGTQRDEAFSVTLQTDGKIIAGGSANSGSADEAAVVRYNANGSLDTSFDGDGKTTVDFQPFFSESFKSVVVQTDGKIIGLAAGGGKYNLARLNPNGSPDFGFGTNGVKIVTVDNGQNGPNKAVLQTDGKLVAAGIGSSAGFAVVRFLTSFGKATFDFDGDGKTDIGIFRPTVGEWWYLRSSDGTDRAVQFGAGSDQPTPGDFTGDGKTDITFFRPSSGEWYILRSENFSFFSFPFGAGGDAPAPADYDGDGRTDAAVFRPSSGTWYILKSNGSGTSIVNFGTNGDKPVAADYDGDGKTDIAIFRPSDGSWWYLRSSDGNFRVFRFGVSTDKPVPGDYTGDGKADIAVFRPSSGEWFVQRSEDNSFFSFPFGAGGDVPAPADYDGDGRTDAAVFRPSGSTWFVNRTTAGLLITNFGTSGDQPLPNVFVP